MSMVYRDEAPEYLRTVAQLRLSGMQPGDPGVAGGWLERVFEGDVWRTVLYDARSAKPLPAPVPRPVPQAATPRAVMGAATPARSDAAAWACAVLQDPDAVVLDTELTDYAGRVIEIAVLATDGTVLLSTLVDPEGAPINHHAQRKHGITAAMLAGATAIIGSPRWAYGSRCTGSAPPESSAMTAMASNPDNGPIRVASRS